MNVCVCVYVRARQTHKYAMMILGCVLRLSGESHEVFLDNKIGT